MKNVKIFCIIGMLLLIISCANGPGPGPVTSQESVKLDINITADGVKVEAEDIDIGPAADKILTEDQRDGLGLGNLSQLSWMDDDESVLIIKIFSGLSVADVTRLFNDLTWLRLNRPDLKDIYIFINSPGGDAFSGLALSDIIINFQKKHGFNIEAHANGIIASAAVPVFASCSKRYATRGTIFMIHEAALWKWPGRETASDIRSQNELMVMLQDLYISYLIDPVTKLNREQWIAKEKATTWFDVNKALEWGLVDQLE